jgi:hypothetical protein
MRQWPQPSRGGSTRKNASYQSPTRARRRFDHIDPHHRGPVISTEGPVSDLLTISRGRRSATWDIDRGTSLCVDPRSTRETGAVTAAVASLTVLHHPGVKVSLSEGASGT